MMFRFLQAKIAARLTVVVSLGLAVVQSVVGVRLLLDEEHDLRKAVRAEMRYLTRSVELGFENAIRDKQLADVEQALVELEAIDSRIDIYVIGPGGEIFAQSKGQQKPPKVPRDGKVHFEKTKRGEAAVTHVRLSGSLEGAQDLVVVRPLDDLRDDLSDTRKQVLVTILCSVAASACLLWVASRRFVGRPLARMIEAMQRFRADMTLALHAPYAQDEVGTALREFAALSAELRAAHERIEDDQASRAELERHLLRADKLATVGQLSAGLAHEVGSPLQVLGGRLHALHRELQENPKAERLLSIAIAQTDRITRVVQQLLSFARQAPALVRAVDPASSARDVVELLQLEAKRHGQVLESDFSRAPAQIQIDPDHLSQIVLNLVRNALEASTESGHVRVVLERSASAMLLRVEDRGRGFTPEQAARLFEPFFTTRGEQGGTGLGLAVVRTLAERYGGRAFATSTPEHGTHVGVEIPLARSIGGSA